MATPVQSIGIPVPRLSALERYAELSLFLLLCNGVLALEWTGKLDPITMVLALAALLVVMTYDVHEMLSQLMHLL